MSALVAPPYDWDSADGELLDNFHWIRLLRTQAFSRDLSQEEADRFDQILRRHESAVYGGSAKTIPGILARLQMSLIDTAGTAWIEVALMQYGLSTAMADKDQLDGNGQQLLLAATELLHLDWNQAVTAYEKSVEHCDMAMRFGQLATTELLVVLDQAGERGKALRTEIWDTIDKAERYFGNNDAEITRLIRTLAPTHDALATKISIVVKEEYAEQAVEWIARDVGFLKGLTVTDIKTGAEAKKGDA